MKNLITAVNTFPTPKIWRKFHWKCSIVPKDSEGLQVQTGTSRERSKSEIKGTVVMQ